MSRATISSGNVTFNMQGDEMTNSLNSSDACHIVILADFSGRSHRGLNDRSSVKQRKVIEIDRDNFDDVFTKMDVQCALPLADEPMCFQELDDMHPDFIYEQISLFGHFRSLKRKLKSSATFAAAAEEIYQWHQSSGSTESIEERNEPTSRTDPSLVSENSSILDSILSDSSATASPSKFDVQALIKDIVAPYATPKPDPREKELVKAVDDAASELLRKIMHHPQFQDIESAWRSLYLLVRRIETNQKLKIFIVDISQQELIEDAMASDDVAQSNIYKLLVANRTAKGSTPFSLIMHAASFGHNIDDIRTLGLLGAVAASSGAKFLAAGTERLAGCESLGKTPDIDDWDFLPDSETLETWNALRAAPQAASIMLVAPRYLCRMPYGKKSAPIDSFSFEELPSSNQHPYYLWSSGAWLVILLLAQNYTICGDPMEVRVQEIGRLPLHVFTDDDGESKVTPCGEILMLDSAASALIEAGLMPIRSILDKDAVVVPGLMSIQK